MPLGACCQIWFDFFVISGPAERGWWSALEGRFLKSEIDLVEEKYGSFCLLVGIHGDPFICLGSKFLHGLVRGGWGLECSGTVACDQRGASIKFFAGHQVTQNFGVEGGYFSLGGSSRILGANSYEWKAADFELFGVGGPPSTTS